MSTTARRFTAPGGHPRGQETFLAPAGLERFAAGSTLRVLELCVGTGTNTAVLLQACEQRQLQLQWWGLELDPQPLHWPSPTRAFVAMAGQHGGGTGGANSIHSLG